MIQWIAPVAVVASKVGRVQVGRNNSVYRTNPQICIASPEGTVDLLRRDRSSLLRQTKLFVEAARHAVVMPHATRLPDVGPVGAL